MDSSETLLRPVRRSGILGAYLGEISGEPTMVTSSSDAARKYKSIIVIGEKMAITMAVDLGTIGDIGDEVL